MQNLKTDKFGQRGFSLIEVIIVLAVLSLLTVSYSYVTSKNGKNKAYLARGESEMVIISNAIKLKVQETSAYPDDVNRGLPAGIEKYIATPNASWPTAPWPNSVYDYENWDSGDTIQISVRFCNAGDDVTCKANAQKYLNGTVSDTVLQSWDSYSSVYFCIKGDCRSHSSKPSNHPGFKIDISSAH